jgi:TonB family protein
MAEFISQETVVSKLFRKCLYSFALLAFIFGLTAFSHGDETRKIKSKVSPQYPVLARKMNVTGSVKLEVFIAANGQVKSVKPLGGHPLLIDAAESAVKLWRFEPGAEGTEIVEIRFNGAN